MPVIVSGCLYAAFSVAINGVIFSFSCLHAQMGVRCDGSDTDASSWRRYCCVVRTAAAVLMCAA